MLNIKKILYSLLVSLILLSSCKNIQNSENDSHLNSRLDSKPVVTNFSDSEGNSVLSGKSLINTNEIQISWDSVKADNVVYQVIIRIGYGFVNMYIVDDRLYILEDPSQGGGRHFNR